MKERKKILWLVSWYPNKNDAFDGDFIQRHARAAAIYNDIHVIFVKDAEQHQPYWEAVNQCHGLTEQIIYFKKPRGVLGKVYKQWKWFSIYEKAVKKYIDKNGKPSLVHVHVPWKAGLIALWVKLRFKIPYIITEHWGIYNNVLEENFSTQSLFFKSFIKHVFKHSLKIISVSYFLGRAINQQVIKKEFEVVPNVVDTGLFFYKESKNSRFTFLHVSNMVPLKNIRSVIDAFAEWIKLSKNKDVQLIMIGNKTSEYADYAKNLNLLNTNIYFKGEIPYAEVAKEMQSAHCFILNSIMENSPCVIGEALCCGLPVIATHVGGVPELVDGFNGILIPPSNHSALLNALETIYSQYRVFDRRKIAEKAFNKYQNEIIGSQIDTIYSANV